MFERSFCQLLPLSYHLDPNCYKLQCVVFISCGPTDFGLMYTKILYRNNIVDADV